MKFLKNLITVSFIVLSFFMTTLIFQKGFAGTDLKFAIDNQFENTITVLLYSTLLSSIGVFLSGSLSLFTYFVFMKVMYADEIKIEAYKLLKYRRVKKNTQLKKELITETKN